VIEIPKRYEYVEGLAELALTFNKRNLKVYLEDFGAKVGNCDYCGARLRYKVFFNDGENKIGIGSCCAAKLSKYLGLPEEYVLRAIKFFKKYIELCRRAEVEPEKIVEIWELDRKIAEIKKIRELKRLQKRLEMRDRAEKNMNKIRFVAERKRWLTPWEREFVESCYEAMTEKMEKILNEIYEKVRHVSDEMVRREKEVRLKLKFIVQEGRGLIWERAYEICYDIYFHQDRPLTERQVAFIDKYFEQLRSKIPDVWEGYARAYLS